MSEGNKILTIVKPGRAEWQDAPMPEAQEGEMILRVEGISTCPHWDMRMFRGVPMFESRPLTYPYVPGEPGHEACGTIEYAPGDSQFSSGDDVVLWRDPGGRRQGCYSRFVAVDADHVLKVSSKISTERLAPLELAMCVQVSFDQLEAINAIRDRHVIIGGMGPAGLIAVQMAKAYGAREVTGTDLVEGRRNLALDVGADSAIHPDELPDNPANSPYETGLDTTGISPAINGLIQASRNAVAVFGVMRDRIGFGPEHWWGGFTLMGYGEHNKEAAIRALRLVETGQVDLSVLISKKLPLTKYQEGVELLESKKAIKVLFDPWSE